VPAEQLPAIVVSRKDRFARARVDIELKSWLLGGAAAILTAILSHDKNWVKLVAGLAAGALVMLFQLVGNYLWRAEPEILRERLVAATKRVGELERHASQKVSLLVGGLAWAQNLAAKRPDSSDAMATWVRDLRVFNNFLNDLVAPRLDDHEWLRLRHADDDGQAQPGAFDDEHRRESRKLRVRMAAIQALIDENLNRP
jgi:hypothetical protein